MNQLIHQIRRSTSRFLKRTWRSINLPFRWLTLGLAISFRAFLNWWGSRRWRAFLWGIPALLAAIACTVYGGLLAARDDFSLAREYVTAANVASKSGDWARAKLCYERALEFGVRTPETLFDLAISAQKAGDDARKVAVLKRIAPDDHAVYAPAHLWHATQVLSAKEVTKELAASAEKQLKYALELDPNNTSAHAILGDLYFQAGLWRSSIEHLQYVRNVNAGTFRYRLMHSKASAAVDELDEARKFAREVQRESKNLVAKDPGNLDARLILGESELLLENYAAAAATLQEGMKLSDSPQLSQSLALVLVHWSDDILDKSPENRAQAFQLLATALETNPNELLLFDRILDLLGKQDQTSLKAEEFLNQNILKGRSTGMSHLVLGTYYFQKDKVREAGVHMEQAFRLLPNGLIVANNYAWYLAKSDPPKLADALKIINSVIERDPLGAEFRDTRGHILLGKQDYAAAVSDFEFAFPKLPPNSNSLRALAAAYVGLGLPDLADQHLKQAEEIDGAKIGQ
jgi:tetratricopeptide (TPR) repeat protein